jgi:hypothetical protein
MYRLATANRSAPNFANRRQAGLTRRRHRNAPPIAASFRSTYASVKAIDSMQNVCLLF